MLCSWFYFEWELHFGLAVIEYGTYICFDIWGFYLDKTLLYFFMEEYSAMINLFRYQVMLEFVLAGLPGTVYFSSPPFLICRSSKTYY